MIRINLLPIKETELAFRRRQQLSVAALVVSVTILLMVVPYVYQKRASSRLEAQIAEKRAELVKYQQQTEEARGLEKKQRELRAKLKVIESLDHKRIGPTRVLIDLSTATPEKLWLEEFTETNGTATVIGWSLDNQTVAEFMRQLATSKYFYGVDLAEATQPLNPNEQPAAILRDGSPVRFKRFVIKASVDYFGRGGMAEEVDEEADAAEEKVGA